MSALPAAPATAPVRAESLRAALERACSVLRRSQREDGAWESQGDMGPVPTAQVVVALHHLGVLSPEDAREAARWLRAQQRRDGAFVLRPFAPEGDAGATACCWAALHVCAPDESAEAIVRARAWLEAHGGEARVLAGLELGDLSALFLALAGLLDARRLPCPPLAFLLVRPLVALLERKFHSGILMGAGQLGVLVKRLRGAWGADGTRKGALDRAGCAKVVTLLETFQNEDGSWNANTLQGALALPTLVAAGLPKDDPRVQRGVQWLLEQRVRDAGGLHFNAFGSAVWSTAFDLRALFAGGVAPSDAGVQRALTWLVDSQLTVPQPAVDNRNPGAPRTGGWGFQRGNHTMADCDDAGVVLSALGEALARPEGVDAGLLARLRDSVQQAHAWLTGMQNPDGGWSAFVWDLPAKRPGPLFERTPRLRLDDPLGMLLRLVVPPRELGDPSTEDVTSRVLHGLGRTGLTVQDARVARAVAFLEKQQCPSGAFWGRWGVNYLTGTSFVLMGLAAVKADLTAAWVQDAVRWVLSKQNPDGGWGEDPASYADAARAGEGPSMAPLTGLVLQALLDVGLGDSDAVARGVAWLLARQRPDGTWPNDDYLHTNVPPDTYYLLPEAARFYPTEALARYAACGCEPHAPAEPPRWDRALLALLRDEMDPPADAMVEQLFRDGSVDAVNRVLGLLFRSDEPVPAGLPAPVRAYLDATGQLPAWADPARIALAQALFTRAGWQVAASLFCSALPQAYAAAHGAHVLTQTQGMTRHVRQRIFETAQFLFDVLDEGALAPGGRGVRTVQKVRLMHAGIRHLLLSRPSPRWDAALRGMPINQEDLAGTLMTFSAVTLDALPRLGVDVTREEAEAWMHTWNVVGHLLGIQPRLLPRDRAEGEALMDAIRDRQWAASEDGRVLVAPLLELMQSYLPGRAFDGVPAALVRHLAGDHCADLLGLPATDWPRTLLDVALELGGALAHVDPTHGRSRLLAHATHLFMEGIVLAEREGKQARFRIPPALQRTVDPHQ